MFWESERSLACMARLGLVIVGDEGLVGMECVDDMAMYWSTDYFNMTYLAPRLLLTLRLCASIQYHRSLDSV